MARTSRYAQKPPPRKSALQRVMKFILVRQLHGRGIGYVDVNWLAAAATAGFPLWTIDKRLDAVTTSLGIPR